MDAVVEFLGLRIDDYGEAFLLSDDETGERLNVAVEDIPIHREQVREGVEVVGTLFSRANFGDDGRRWDIDFQIENGEVVEYRVHKHPVLEGERWLLQERERRRSP